MEDSHLESRPTMLPLKETDLQTLAPAVTEAVLAGRLDIETARELVALNLEIEEKRAHWESERNDKKSRRRFYWALLLLAVLLVGGTPWLNLPLSLGFLALAALIISGVIINARERDQDWRPLLILGRKALSIFESFRREGQ